MLFWGKKPVVGLDVGTYQIKIAQFDYGKSEFNFLYREELPLEISQEKIPDSPARKAYLTKRLNEIFQRFPLEKKRIVVMLQGENLFYKYIELPIMKAKELAVAIPIEAKKYIPYQPQDMVLSYSAVDDIEGEKTKQGIILTAVPRDIIQERLKLFQGFGFNPLTVDIAAACLNRLYTFNCPVRENAVALLNIGAKWTHLSILKGDNVYFSKDIALGGNDFTYAIEIGSGYTTEEAETYKLNLNLQEKQETHLMPFLQKLSEQIKRVIYFYNTKVAGKSSKVNRILLSGGSAWLKGLDQYLSDYLKMEVKIEPLDLPIKKELRAKMIPEEQLFFIMAMGLALWDL